MKFKEACPTCGSEEYEILDYSDDFDPYGAIQWWYCKCSCGQKFEIHKTYHLTEATITKEEELA